MKLKEILVDCKVDCKGSDIPERIFIKAQGGKWNGHVHQYSSMFNVHDKHHEYRQLDAATKDMNPADIVIEYVAVTRYRCRVESE